MALERVEIRLASAQTLARYACEYTVNADSSTQFTPVILDGGLGCICVQFQLSGAPPEGPLPES